MPEDEIQDKSRRTFLKAMIVLSAGAAVAGCLALNYFIDVI